MTDETFEAFIKKNVHEQPETLPYYAKKRCPDQVVGYVKFAAASAPSTVLWLEKRRRKAHFEFLEAYERIQQSIVLVIESPHKDEFRDPAFIAPALGKTGEYLERFLPQVLEQLQRAAFVEGKYTLILANTIQYQCSLGELPKVYRDRVWGALWEGEKAAFLERIAAYQPHFILEMCTSSDGRKVKVQQALKERFHSVPLFETPHPSSWWQESNRRFGRVQPCGAKAD